MATPAPGTRPRRRSIGTLDTVTGGFLDREPRCLRLVPAVDLVRIKLSLRSEAKPIHFRRLGLSPISVQDSLPKDCERAHDGASRALCAVHQRVRLDFVEGSTMSRAEPRVFCATREPERLRREGRRLHRFVSHPLGCLLPPRHSPGHCNC